MVRFAADVGFAAAACFAFDLRSGPGVAPAGRVRCGPIPSCGLHVLEAGEEYASRDPVPDPSGDAVAPQGPFEGTEVPRRACADAGAGGDAEAPDPVPDPFEDAESLAELEEEIAVLAAHIHAATHRLLTLVAEFDRRRGWELGGHRSCAHWLAFRTGIDLGAAREKVRAARALTGLPETAAAMARGELSFSAVRALTRVATAENEADLLELARGCTAAELERAVRGWRVGSRETEAERERRRHEGRELSVFPDAEGMYVVRGRLTPEVGALLMRAVEAASDALWREERRGPETEVGRGVVRESGVGRESHPGDVSAETSSGSADGSRQGSADARSDVSAETSDACTHGGDGERSVAWRETSRDPSRAEAARRRADALGLLAERALAAGFGGADGAPLSGTRAERYQVVLHVDADTLAAEGEPGRSELGDGTRVSAETSRRLACDAAVVILARSPGDEVLDVGRKTRTIPPALRRALEARDRGCRFPGCGLRFTAAHHVRHWADGGETALSNLVLLCRHHHRLVHEEGWAVQWWGEGEPAFVDPRGQVRFRARRRTAPEAQPAALDSEPKPSARMPDVQPAAPPPQLAAALVAANRRAGIEPDYLTAGARWKRAVDVPDEVWFRAREAIG